MKFENKKSIFLTFDAEPFWTNIPVRYDRSTWQCHPCASSSYWSHKFIDYCEAHNLPATIFIVGKWAEQNISFVRRVANSPLFQIGSHSHWHEDMSLKEPFEFLDDIITSKKVIEDISGIEVIRFRAPSFSLRTEQLQMLEDSGYSIDSSICLAHRLHGGQQVITDIPTNLELYPMKGSVVGRRQIILLGGGYLRMLPKSVLASIIQRNLGNMIYLHPHDLPIEMPAFKELRFNENFRKRIRIGNIFEKLDLLRNHYNIINF